MSQQPFHRSFGMLLEHSQKPRAEGKPTLDLISMRYQPLLPLSKSVLLLPPATCPPSKDREKRVGYAGANRTCGCTLLRRGEQPGKCTCGENSPSWSLCSGLSHVSGLTAHLSHKAKTPFLWADSVCFFVFLGLHLWVPQLCCSPSRLPLLHLLFVSYETHQEVRLQAGVIVAPGRDPE